VAASQAVPPASFCTIIRRPSLDNRASATWRVAVRGQADPVKVAAVSNSVLGTSLDRHDPVRAAAVSNSDRVTTHDQFGLGKTVAVNNFVLVTTHVHRGLVKAVAVS
jgi:hypothetical protein